MPASTDPTPPAGDGVRFAAIPRKNPCTSTANGTSPPKASKLAQSTPMFAAQKPKLSPTWFGYHEVWHALGVTAGVLLFVMNLGLISAA